MNEIDALAKITGRSRTTIYLEMKKLRAKGIDRLPTKEEILARKSGRPRQYNY